MNFYDVIIVCKDKKNNPVSLEVFRFGSIIYKMIIFKSYNINFDVLNQLNYGYKKRTLKNALFLLIGSYNFTFNTQHYSSLRNIFGIRFNSDCFSNSSNSHIIFHINFS